MYNMSISRTNILKLYKTLLREGSHFSSYNFRSYALRRIRDAFKGNKEMTDPYEILKQYKFGTEQLAVIKRQVLVGNLYSTDKLIIEKKSV